MARTRKKPEVLDASLNFPNLQIKFTSSDPIASLRELNKLLNTVRNLDMALDTVEFDDPLFFRFMNLSDELRNHSDSMEFLRAVNKVEENFKQKKVAIENLKIIDFTNKSYSTSLDNTSVHKKISQLVAGVEKADYALVHILGAVSAEEKQMLVDAVSNKIPRAQVKSLLTDKELLGKTVIEGIFFGDFTPD